MGEVHLHVVSLSFTFHCIVWTQRVYAWVENNQKHFTVAT